MATESEPSPHVKQKHDGMTKDCSVLDKGSAVAVRSRILVDAVADVQYPPALCRKGSASCRTPRH